MKLMLAEGEVVSTRTGRRTTPFPKVDTTTNRKAINTLKRVHTWLMANAQAEAQVTKNRLAELTFTANMNKPQQADLDGAHAYLFDETSKVAK